MSQSCLTILSVRGMAGDKLRLADYELAKNAYWIGTAAIFTLTVFLGYQLQILKDKIKAKIAK